MPGRVIVGATWRAVTFVAAAAAIGVVCSAVALAHSLYSSRSCRNTGCAGSRLPSTTAMSRWPYAVVAS